MNWKHKYLRSCVVPVVINLVPLMLFHFLKGGKWLLKSSQHLSHLKGGGGREGNGSWAPGCNRTNWKGALTQQRRWAEGEAVPHVDIFSRCERVKKKNYWSVLGLDFSYVTHRLSSNTGMTSWCATPEAAQCHAFSRCSTVIIFPKYMNRRPPFHYALSPANDVAGSEQVYVIWKKKTNQNPGLFRGMFGGIPQSRFW